MKPLAVLCVTLQLLLGASSSPARGKPNMTRSIMEHKIPHPSQLENMTKDLDLMDPIYTPKYLFDNAAMDDEDDLYDDDDDGDDIDDDEEDHHSNGTTTNTTTTSSSHLSKRLRRMRKGKHRLIGPDTDINWSKYSCEMSQPPIKLENVNAARERLAAWGEGALMEWGRWHGEVVGQAFWYVCYCRKLISPGIKIHALELQQAQDLLRAKCGPGLGGADNATFQPAWLWSYDWQRVWSIMPRRSSHVPQMELCPYMCLRPKWLQPNVLMQP